LAEDLKRIGLLTCSAHELECRNLIKLKLTWVEEEPRQKQISAWAMDHLVVSSVDNGAYLLPDLGRDRKRVAFKEVAKYGCDGNVELENVTDGHLKTFKAFDGSGDRFKDVAKLLQL
jgi:hypothetical protein